MRKALFAVYCENPSETATRVAEWSNLTPGKEYEVIADRYGLLEICNDNNVNTLVSHKSLSKYSHKMVDYPKPETLRQIAKRLGNDIKN